VSYAEHWADGQERTVWSCWHSVLFYAVRTGLICDVCTGTGVAQSINMLQDDMLSGSSLVNLQHSHASLGTLQTLH
jgi:hypothetical protein